MWMCIMVFEICLYSLLSFRRRLILLCRLFEYCFMLNSVYLCVIRCVKGPLVRWLKLNFTEVYVAWLHVKSLRIFVESVMRYYQTYLFYKIFSVDVEADITIARKRLN